MNYQHKYIEGKSQYTAIDKDIIFIAQNTGRQNIGRCNNEYYWSIVTSEPTDLQTIKDFAKIFLQSQKQMFIKVNDQEYKVIDTVDSSD